MAMGTVVRGLGRLFASGGMTGMTEGQLLDRFVNRRDEEAFEALVARHGPMVLAVCGRLLTDPNDVDDAFQATFLVLVQKAGSLRRQDLLGNWLFGVAYRVSARARATAARRHEAETATPELVPAREPSPAEAASLRELLEEVQRLAERYRAPVVLCDIEGLTHEEAAAQLGWPVGTVKGRLSRARDLLRSRLTRRGLDPAAAIVASPLGLRQFVPPAPPPGLVASTVKAAALAVVGETSAVSLGLITARAVALSEGVLHAMTLNQLKTGFATLALSGTLLSGAGVYAYQFGGLGGDAKRPSTAAPDTATKSSRLDPLTRLRKDANVVFAEHLADPNVEKTSHHIDRLFHWSRAIKESQEYITKDPQAIAQARKDHLDRMTLLHQFTQRLSGPDQPAMADTARASKEQAARELETGQARSGLVVTMPGGGANAPAPPTAVEAPLAVTGPPVAGQPAAGPAPPTAGQPPQVQFPGMGGGGMGGGGMGGGGMGVADSEEQRTMRTMIARSALSFAAQEKSANSKRILKALDEPVSMNFASPTPFKDVLKYIQVATSGPKDAGLPIYVDPKALEDADVNDDSTIVMNLEGVPLKTTLRLLLKQLKLAYCVRDGVLIISSIEGIYEELTEAEEQRDEAATVESSKTETPKPKVEAEKAKNPQ
jgi:RNA polymerase sigma factor (sigma-70 family)